MVLTRASRTSPNCQSFYWRPQYSIQWQRQYLQAYLHFEIAY